MKAHATVKVLFGAATKWAKLLSLLLPPPLRPHTLPILTPELIVLILLRLPARSLLKFKTVCKSWKTLISSSDFTKNQAQLSMMAEPAVTDLELVYSNLFHHGDNKIGFIPIQSLLENLSSGTEVVYYPMDGYVNISGSINGFLCLTNLPSAYLKVKLLNPCTGLASEWFKLHLENEEHMPEISNFGFGYDHVNDKYKILVVVERSTRIYTFGEYSWITVQDIPLHPSERDGTFVTGTGTLNWIATKIASSAVNYPVIQDTIVVLSFDFGNERYGQIALPDAESGLIHCEPVLVTLKNSLCVCHGYKNSTWDLWMMKEYGNEDSWTRMLVISHEGLMPRALAVRPLSIMENDLLLALVRIPAYRKRSRLAVYNPATEGQLEYPVINYSSNDDMPKYDYPHQCFCVYRESLVSPSHYGLKTEHAWLWDDDDDET